MISRGSQKKGGLFFWARNWQHLDFFGQQPACSKDLSACCLSCGAYPCWWCLSLLVVLMPHVGTVVLFWLAIARSEHTSPRCAEVEEGHAYAAATRRACH